MDGLIFSSFSPCLQYLGRRRPRFADGGIFSSLFFTTIFIWHCIFQIGDFMYYMVKMENTIRIPPEHIGKNLEEVSEKIVQETFESTMDKNNGLILIAKNVQRSGEGKIIHGDGAIYQDVKFDALTFKPELQEIIDGIICDIVEFGAFCHIGPLDALIHKSQIMDDHIVIEADEEDAEGGGQGKSKDSYHIPERDEPP